MEKNHTSAADLFSLLTIEIFRTHVSLVSLGDSLIQDIGLTTALWQVLHIVDQEPLPVAEIARRLGITRQSVLRTVNTLKKKGFIALRDNPQHQRAKLVDPLNEGKKRLEIARTRQRDWVSKQALHMTARQLQEGITLLQSMQQCIPCEAIPLCDSPEHYKAEY